MTAAHFRAGGALSDDDAAVYVERSADHEALLHLRAMEYLLIIEPRQQGKTSLVNHLMSHPAMGDMVLAYGDVTTPDRSSEAAWYQTLCPRIMRQLKFIPADRWPAMPSNGSQWREFLFSLATLAADAERRIVIALDEIGAVTFPAATEFFSVLRDAFNSRQSESEFKHLTFLLTGAFHPRDLIADDHISPFNIAQRVRLRDFEQSQVDELVLKIDLSHPLKSENELTAQIREVSDRIFYWTDGQPYLTQWICRYLASRGPRISAANVDGGVERLRREDENHLPPLLDRLNSDDSLRGYVAKIRSGERIRFYPREHRRQAQLELLGVIKADSEDYCRIRNRIYELALESAVYGHEAIERPAPQVSSPHGMSATFNYQAVLEKYEGKRVLPNQPIAPPQFFVYRGKLCHLSPEAATLLDYFEVEYEHLDGQDEAILDIPALRGVTINSAKHMESILKEVRPDVVRGERSPKTPEPKYNIHIETAIGSVFGDQAQVKQTFDASLPPDADALWQKMEPRLAGIEHSLQTGFGDLKRGQAVLYRQIGQAYHEPLSQLLELVQSGRLEHGEMERTLDAIRRALRAMQKAEDDFSDELRQAVTSLSSAIESNLTLQQKFEISLPIIPMFLEYKVELAAGSKVDLNAIRAELAQRWSSLLDHI